MDSKLTEVEVSIAEIVQSKMILNASLRSTNKKEFGRNWGKGAFR
jgi:hypothetical protein